MAVSLIDKKMKKVAIFLLPDFYSLTILENFKKVFPKLEAVVFSYQKSDWPMSFVFKPGQEFKTVLEKLEGRKVAAVINRGDTLETLHGKLVDHYQVPGPSYSSIIAFKDKAKMHQLMLDSDLDFYRPKTIVADLTEIEKALEKVQFPVVIKPFAGAKSRGVFKLNKKSEAKEAIKLLTKHFNKESSLVVKNSSDKKVLIEEYIDGKQLTCTCYVDDKSKLHVLTFVDVLTAKDLGKNHMQLIYRSCPSRFNEAIFNKVTFILQRLIKLTNLKSTCIHPEFFVVGKRVILIEVNVRIGGFREDLLKLSTGLELGEIGINLALGKKVSDDFEMVGSACACEVWEEKSGIIESINFPKNKYLKNQKIKVSNGEKYLEPPYGNIPIASFFVSNEDNALGMAKKIRKNIKIDWQE